MGINKKDIIDSVSNDIINKSTVSKESIEPEINEVDVIRLGV